MLNINQNIISRRKTFSIYNDLNDTITVKSENSLLNSYQNDLNIQKKYKMKNQIIKNNDYKQQKISAQQGKFLKVNLQKKQKNRLIQANLDSLIQRQWQKQKSRTKIKNKLTTLIDDLNEQKQKNQSLKSYQDKNQNGKERKKIFTERTYPTINSNNQLSITSPYKGTNHSTKNLNKSQFLVGFDKIDQSSTILTQQIIISDNFQGSFKAIFNQLIQVFYLQLFLKNILRHDVLDIWNFLVQKSRNFSKQINDFYPKKRQFKQTITFKQMLFKFLQMFQEYEVKQIKNMIHMQISTSSLIKYQDFLNLFQKDKFHVDLVGSREYQNKYIKNSNQNCSIIKTYFKTLIEMTHCQKVLKKLIRANQRMFYQVVLAVSNGNYFSQTKFAQYITSQNGQGRYVFNATKIKIQTFLQRLKSKENIKGYQKITKYQFIKCMKTDQI